MVNISNELSTSSPIKESIYETEAQKAFQETVDINDGISKLLRLLTDKPEAQGYKFVINATSIEPSLHGPIKTYTGAYWNAEQDGTWATHLEPAGLLVTITWIHL